MRVGVINYPACLGVESVQGLLEEYRTLTGWAASVHETGCTVRVFQGFSRDTVVERDGVGFECVGGPFVPDLARWWVPRRLHSRVAAWRPEVVHLNSLTYPLQLLDLRRQLDRGCAVVAQHHAARPMKGWRHRVQRLALKSVDGLLFTGAAVADPWIESGVVDTSTPIWAVAEGSSTLHPQDRQDCRKATGTGGEPMLLWAGNLDVNKDPLLILDAVAAVAMKRPGVRLWMAYRTAPLLEQVRRRVAEDSALSGRVVLLGEQSFERMGQLMSAADLLVQGSAKEGSGYAVIDALACGLPPVVTDIPSFRYLTDNGRIGALFRRGDAEHLATTLLSVLEAGNADRGEPARRWFERRLAWPAVGRRATAAYRLARCLRRRQLM